MKSAPKASQPTPSRGVGRAALWFGLLGGGVAWLVHFLTIYVVAEFGGVSGWGQSPFLGITVQAWLLLVISLLMTVGAGAAAYVAHRSRRFLRQTSPTEDDLERHAAGWHMARAGYVASSLFLFIILVESLPIFFFLRP
jgi:hypothetical protein